MSSAAAILGPREKQLAEALAQVLRETAFDNRYSLHPRRFGEIASEVSASFLRFLEAPGDTGACDCSRGYAREGLGEKTILQLASCLRRFSLQHLGWDARSLDMIESFTMPFLEGYMQAREQQVLKDQEQIRLALSTAMERQNGARG